MITFTGVSKYFPNGDAALTGIDLKIEKGSATALLGEEGSGKSTLLRMINRMVDPSEGLVEVGGVDVSRVPLEEHRQKIGFVLPGGGLIPNFTVLRNLELNPGLAVLPASRRKERIDRMLDILQIPAKTFPPSLSAMDRLRVGFARALVASPLVLLADEPFVGLVRHEREEMRREFLRMRFLNPDTTFVFATCDMVEAVKLSSSLVVMKETEILEAGKTRSIINKPSTKYTEGLVNKNRFQIQLEAVNIRELMIREPIYITTSQAGLPVSRAIFLMRRNRISALLVTDENRVFIGIINLDDAQGGNPERRIEDVLVKPPEVLRTTDSFSDALRFFMEHEDEFLPVTDENTRLEGLITRKGVSQYLEKLLNKEGNNGI